MTNSVIFEDEGPSFEDPSTVSSRNSDPTVNTDGSTPTFLGFRP